MICTDKDLEDMSTPLWITSAGSKTPNNLYFCLFCKTQYASTVANQASTVLSSLFNDALLDTDSPARALQAFFSSTLRSAYYTWLPLFDMKANATTTSFVNRLAPVSRRGFWGVMAIILTHIVVCLLTTVAFFYRTNFSLLGNIWTTIAQVVHSEEAHAAVQDGTMKTDKEVYRVLNNNSGMRKRHRVQYYKQDNFVTFAPISKPGVQE